MYKKISLLLIVTLVIGCSSGFKVTTYSDYKPSESYNDRSNIPIVYNQHKINKIKSDDKNYIKIAVISGHNVYGSPVYDEVFKQQITGMCNELDGDMALYEMDKSVPKNYLHTYTIVK